MDPFKYNGVNAINLHGYYAVLMLSSSFLLGGLSDFVFCLFVSILIYLERRCSDVMYLTHAVNEVLVHGNRITLYIFTLTPVHFSTNFERCSLFSHYILRSQKANDTISVRPSKIIRTELLKTDFEVPHDYTKSFRKNMYDLRRKDFPTFPQFLNSAVIQLKEMQNEDRFKFKNEKIIHVPENQNFI
ncbi:hypothetical protein AGLY_012376 [Aphis glycines]|uniref:Uncharacterized protein n=1 Tax=Aphis glycines TaxID=307491 RepID=A0A6G0TB80_APHGL|nr:hypothetical protein AGLY_012376 [Aphis glycines]